MEGIKLLLIDDDPGQHDLIRVVLKDMGLEILSATDAESGIEIFNFSRPHIVLLDWKLGSSIDGGVVLQQIRPIDETASILVVTSNDDLETKVDAFNQGADDYIVKPFQNEELKARIKSHLRINQLTKELFTANLKLQELVVIDELTALYKAKPGFERIELELKRSRRHDLTLSLVMLDLDDFKEVNDQQGNIFGSFVISRVGAIINETIREVDFGIRFGGDEFLICLTGANEKGAQVFCKRLKDAIENEEFEKDEHKRKITISMGLAVSKKGSFVDTESFMKVADKALYQSKDKGKSLLTTIVEGDDGFPSASPPAPLRKN